MVTTLSKTKSALALLGGPKAVTRVPSEIFDWPIVTKEHEDAVLRTLRQRKMSGFDITMEFEKAYAKELGMEYALGHNTGTAAIQSAFYGLGIGAGDEVICPSMTYWASVLQVFSLGATVVFAEIKPDTLCLDADDIEHRITPRTKAIIVVHYAGMVADMDAIMSIARKHKVKVFEDCSHAHNCLYKGRQVGTFGDASGFSLMTGKSFAIGEAGIMFTNDKRVYERAVLFGHYERHDCITLADLKEYAGLPCGGYKYRMHQLSSAFGLVQLKYYKQQFAEIDQAMNYFCDLIDRIPGLHSMRPAKESGCTKGGWYAPHAMYYSEDLGGLSVARFSDAVNAEGVYCYAGCNKPLHLHPLFTKMDVYGHGKATRTVHLPFDADISQPIGSLPITEAINERCCYLPRFVKFDRDIVEQHAEAYKKVALNYSELLAGDTHKGVEGTYSNFRKK